MTTVDEDKKQIINTMNADLEFAKDLRKLSNETLAFLRDNFILFANNHMTNDEEQQYILDKVPGKKERDNLKKLIDDIKGTSLEKDEYLIQLVNQAGSNYKTSISAYIEALITVLVAKQMAKTNNLSVEYAEKDEKSNINYLTKKGGDFQGKKIRNLYPVYSDVEDDNHNIPAEQNYTATVAAITLMSNAVRGEIRKGSDKDGFIQFVGSAMVAMPIVSKRDVGHVHGNRTVEFNLSGGLSRLESTYLRNYRTATAKAHTLFKYNLGKYFNIKYGMIINELGACKYCMQNIGIILGLEDAVSRVPQHYNCRCEVKLVNKDGETSFIDM